MAATFIPVTLADFERHFSVKNPKTGKRVFTLVQPEGSEAYYTYTHKSREGLGKLVLKVLTTLAPGASTVRDVGKDAIRCYLLWQDENGWETCIGKTNRTYRSGGPGSTADDVIKRTMAKCREALRETFKVCPHCGRPMTLRTVKKGERKGQKFWGCCAFSYEDCKGTLRHER